MTGIDFVVLAIGLLGVSEILFNLQQGVERDAGAAKTGSLMPTRQDFKQAFPAVLRGTALGSFLGVLPGGGAIMSSFASYALERKIANSPKSGHPGLCTVSSQLRADMLALRDAVIYTSADPQPLLQELAAKLQPELDAAK